MTAVFGICALVGGTIMVLQFVMLFVGLGDTHDIDVVDDLPDDLPGHFDHDVAHDADHHDSTGFFRVISFRTVVAALAFFGLAGLASYSADVQPAPTLAIAVGTSQQVISKLEKGVTNLTEEWMCRLADGLEVAPGDFISGNQISVPVRISVAAGSLKK